MTLFTGEASMQPRTNVFVADSLRDTHRRRARNENFTAHIAFATCERGSVNAMPPSTSFAPARVRAFATTGRALDTAEIAFVIPTRNEIENVPRLVGEMERVLADERTPSCVLIVDDSDDATAEIVAGLARQRSWLHLLHRTPAHRSGGLAGAVLAGFEQVDADVLVVLDGDLQHPPRVALELARHVARGCCDVAIGSRYIEGGSPSGLGGPYRRLVSRAANRAARRRLPRLAGVSDPMTGCFAVHRRVLTGANVQADGFKILLEILARGAWTAVHEVPLAFGERDDGASKATMAQGLRYLRQLSRLRRELERRPSVIDLRESAEVGR